MSRVTPRSFGRLACAMAWLAVSAAPAAAAGPVAHATRLGSAPAEQAVQLVLPLRVDGAGLTRFARAVSTPGSPQYSQYESIARLA
jgi:hypothetical protein